MAIRVEWDEHEQAILLCALIKVLNHELDRKQTVKTVSKQLRELAKDNGIVIDDKFRNENGIALLCSDLCQVLIFASLKGILKASCILINERRG